MKLTKVVGVSTLSLFLGASALMYAQEEKPKDESRPEATKEEKARPAQDNRGGMSKPQENQDNNKDRAGKMPEQTEDKATRGDDRAAHQQENSTQMQHGAQGQNTAQAHGGNRGGGHIPDDKFHSSFGRQHTFVVSRPTVVGGQPQFVYGGYTFNMIDTWPADWSYSDQVYVDYVDGQYFLYDLAHPGVQVAIVVVM
jgi:hypothetical protein